MSDLYEATGKVLEEPVLRAVVACSVLGLNHLHSHRSIHRVRVNIIVTILIYDPSYAFLLCYC